MSNTQYPELKMAYPIAAPSYEEATSNIASGQNTFAGPTRTESSGTHLNAAGLSGNDTMKRSKSTGKGITNRLKGLFSGSGGSSSSSGEKSRRNSFLPQDHSQPPPSYAERKERHGNDGEEKVIQKPKRTGSVLATDDELKALADYDTVFVIDDSSSMHERTSTHTNETHWEQAGKVLESLVSICSSFDTNGIDVYFLNSMLGRVMVKRRGKYDYEKFIGKNIKRGSEAMRLFKDREAAYIQGSTPTAESLHEIIAPYVKECLNAWSRNKENPAFPKPVNIILITDGAANNNVLLIQYLNNWARALDRIDAPPDQLGIQFFQVGNKEGVSQFLMYLDSAMSEEGGYRDMVDTKSSEEMGELGLTGRRILTTVLGAVNRRLDREMDWQAVGLSGPPQRRKKSSDE